MTEIVVQNVDMYVVRRLEAGLEHLLLRRAMGRLYAGSWRMVAGKIDPGEQAWQAAVRELWEETGLYPKELVAVPSVNQFYEWQTDRIQSIPVFAAVVTSDPRLNPEHDAFVWLPAKEACRKLEWPEQRRLLQLVEDLLSGGALPESVRIPVDGLPGGS